MRRPILTLAMLTAIAALTLFGQVIPFGTATNVITCKPNPVTNAVTSYNLYLFAGTNSTGVAFSTNTAHVTIGAAPRFPLSVVLAGRPYGFYSARLSAVNAAGDSGQSEPLVFIYWAGMAKPSVPVGVGF